MAPRGSLALNWLAGLLATSPAGSRHLPQGSFDFASVWSSSAPSLALEALSLSTHRLSATVVAVRRDDRTRGGLASPEPGRGAAD